MCKDAQVYGKDAFIYKSSIIPNKIIIQLNTHMNDQEPIEQLSNELSQITQDFCENYDITLGEFNQLMLLQILDSYANVGKQKEFLDHLAAILGVEIKDRS